MCFSTVVLCTLASIATDDATPMAVPPPPDPEQDASEDVSVQPLVHMNPITSVAPPEPLATDRFTRTDLAIEVASNPPVAPTSGTPERSPSLELTGTMAVVPIHQNAIAPPEQLPPIASSIEPSWASSKPDQAIAQTLLESLAQDTEAGSPEAETVPAPEAELTQGTEQQPEAAATADIEVAIASPPVEPDSPGEFESPDREPESLSSASPEADPQAANPVSIMVQALSDADSVDIPITYDATLLATSDLSIEDLSIETAQLFIEPPPESEVRDLQQELLDVEETDVFGNVYEGSPAVTIAIPSGYGADNFRGFANFSFQSRTRFSNEADATMGVGIGLGDADEAVGFQLSYTLASFGTNREFGTGGFNAKLHRRLPGGWSIAAGWEGFITTGDDPVDFEDSIYGAVTHIIRTTPDIADPFSRIAITAGVGNGRFRSEDAIFDDDDTVGVFGSIAARIARPVSAIVEWTGQDLAAGVSVAPIRDFPWVITPAVRDLTGAGDGARFVLSTGISWQF
jgi:hypothetical protein